MLRQKFMVRLPESNRPASGEKGSKIPLVCYRTPSLDCIRGEAVRVKHRFKVKERWGREKKLQKGPARFESVRFQQKNAPVFTNAFLYIKSLL